MRAKLTLSLVWRACHGSKTYGPDTLKVMGQAFDGAWTYIERNFGHDAKDVEKARLRLAHALLAVATEDDRDVDALKNRTLQAMALAYNRKPSKSPQTAN